MAGAVAVASATMWLWGSVECLTAAQFAALRPVLMSSAVIVFVPMSVAVLMIVVVIMSVTVTVTVTVGISTTLRFERRKLGGWCQTEAREHGIEDVIGAVANPAFAHLHGHVPVTEVIGGPGKLLWIRRSHRGDRFRFSLHFDECAVCGLQSIAAAQERASRQLQPCFLP